MEIKSRLLYFIFFEGIMNIFIAIFNYLKKINIKEIRNELAGECCWKKYSKINSGNKI